MLRSEGLFQVKKPLQVREPVGDLRTLGYTSPLPDSTTACAFPDPLGFADSDDSASEATEVVDQIVFGASAECKRLDAPYVRGSEISAGSSATTFGSKDQLSTRSSEASSSFTGSEALDGSGSASVEAAQRRTESPVPGGVLRSNGGKGRGGSKKRVSIRSDSGSGSGCSDATSDAALEEPPESFSEATSEESRSSSPRASVDPISARRRKAGSANSSSSSPRGKAERKNFRVAAVKQSVGGGGGSGGSSPRSPKGSRRKSRKSQSSVGSVEAGPVAGGDDEENEEAKFLEILDLLEAHDEFDSSSSSGDSVIGDDDSTLGSEDSEAMDSDASLEDQLESNEERKRQFAEWGPIEGWELAAAVMDLRHRRLPNPSVVARVMRDVGKLYSKCPTLVHIERPAYDCRLIVVGDLHRHFGDLMHILDEHGDPSPGPGGTMYLFNGDLVDRGEWGPEVMLLIYCLKLQFPQAVFINRGNHEDDQQNALPDNGFRDQHCNRAWKLDGRAMYSLCRWSFKQLPLMHVIGNDIAVMHGGLPLDRNVTLQEINSIDRKHRVPINSVNLLGYPRGQKVKAKVEIVNEDLDAIPAGTIGRLSRRVKTTSACLVKFDDLQAEIEIYGAPELEDEIEICFETRVAKTKQRLNRIFVALLWSDPCKPGRSAPSKRGVGCYFDENVTRNFLETNGLSCIVRSHEKRAKGYCNEHMSIDKVLTATVFSASNYPGGAGEPHGNEASVIVLKMPAQQDKVSLPLEVPSWREPYSAKSKFTTNGQRDAILHKLSTAEAELQDDQPEGDPESSRVRVIKKLRSMIYCSRPALLNFWNRIDDDCTGWVTAYEWANAMRACVVPDEDFPWEWLMKHLTLIDDFGNCHYASFLSRFENALLRRLAQRWHCGVVTQIAPGVQTEADAEEFWQQVDRDGNGKLSYSELRPVLRTKSPMSFASKSSRSAAMTMDSTAEDDRVYSILQSLDIDKSGFVDKDEFIAAVVSANRRKASVGDGVESDGGAALASRARRVPFSSQLSAASALPASYSSVSSSQGLRASTFSSGQGLRASNFASNQSGMDLPAAFRRKSRKMSRVLDRELEVSGDQAIAQCWLAAQSALRALAAARCSVESVFEVLDTDHDGDIDREEFKEGLMQLIHHAGVIQSIDKWEPLLWKLVDEDGSGSVSHAELTHLLSVRDIVPV